MEIDVANDRRKSRQSVYLGGGDSQDSLQDHDIKYVEIDVFLTACVYNKSSV